VEEVDDGPRRAGGAAEDGEDEEPGEEEDEDVARPDARVHEPLGVLVQIRGRERLHVQLRHRAGGSRPEQSPPARPPDRLARTPFRPGPTGERQGAAGRRSSSELCGRLRGPLRRLRLRWRDL